MKISAERENQVHLFFCIYIYFFKTLTWAVDSFWEFTEVDFQLHCIKTWFYNDPSSPTIISSVISSYSLSASS